MKKSISALALLASLSAFSAHAQEGRVSWDIPTQRIDGTKITKAEIKQYKLYYGVTTGNYTTTVDIVRDAGTNALPSDFTLSLPTGAMYYFAMSTVDTDDKEGPTSPEVALDFTTNLPIDSPSNLIIITISIR